MVPISPDKARRPNSKSPRLSRVFSRFLKSKSAATSLEYALIIAGITVAIIVSVSLLGESSNNAFKKIGDRMDGVTEPGQQTSGDTDSSSAGGSSGDSGGSSVSGSTEGSGSGSGRDSGGDSGGSFDSSSAGGSSGNSRGSFDSNSGRGSGIGSGESFDGGTDDGSGSGSIDGKSSEDSMYVTAGAINGNQGYVTTGAGLSDDTSSGYGSGKSSINKEENSAGSVDGRNESGNPNEKLTKKIRFYKSWLFALILILGILLFYMSRKNNKVEDKKAAIQKPLT